MASVAADVGPHLSQVPPSANKTPPQISENTPFDHLTSVKFMKHQVPQSCFTCLMRTGVVHTPVTTFHQFPVFLSI